MFLAAENSIVTGFQLACSAGPLCDEPLEGVAFVVEAVHLTQDWAKLGERLRRYLSDSVCSWGFN